jgi:PAS domain S-box-containing protein
MVFNNGVLEQRNLRFILQPEEELQFAKSFMERVADAVFWVDPDAQFLYVNDATCHLVGYSREELLSMTMHDVDPDFSTKVWSEYWRTIKHQGSFSFESLHRTKEGWSFPVELTVTYLEYHGREYGCILVRNITKRKQLEIALDKANEALECRLAERTAELRDANEQLCREITERKQAESALRESEERFRATFNQAAVGIARIGIDGKWLLVNQKLCDIVGYTQFELLERTFQAITHPDDLNVESDYIRQCSANVIQTYSMEKRYIRKDSSPVWINLTMSLVRESSGTPKYFIAVVEDITERKHTEEALRQSEARFRTLAETSDAIIFINQGTHFCYVNPAAEAITGYRREELLAYPDISELIKERRQLHRRDKSVFLQDEEIKHCEEIKILTKNGEERWLNCCIGVIEFEGKLAVLGTAIDITKHKQAEVEIRQALEQEKELSELQARFISMVSHEFRTPLNNISFSTSSLRRYSHQWTEEEKLEYLCGIETDIEQLNSLLDEALIIGGAEAGKRKFQPRPLDVAQFCRDIVAEMQQSDSGQHVFSFVSQGDCRAGCVDKKLLRPILTNLLSNAIKYSPSDSQVDLELSCWDGDLIFQIKDRGIGIPAADRQQLFESFHRGRNVGDIQGTGLGLSVVKKFVDLHGGQINVVSEVGVGTTFTVTLPLDQQQKKEVG